MIQKKYMERLTKNKLAKILGGAYIAKNGKVNSRKLKTFVCNALKISEDDYKTFRMFTKHHIEIFKAKKIL